MFLQGEKGGLRCGHSSKKGGLRCGHSSIKGGLRCGSNSKKGGIRCGQVEKEGSLPRHIPMLNIYVSTPPPRVWLNRIIHC